MHNMAVYNASTISNRLSPRIRRFVKNFNQEASRASVEAADASVIRCIQSKLLEDNNIATGKLYASVDAVTTVTRAGFISTEIGYINIPYGEDFENGGIRDNVDLGYLTQWVSLKANKPSKYSNHEWARYIKHILETRGARPYPHVEECWEANKDIWATTFRSNLNKAVKSLIAGGGRV